MFRGSIQIVLMYIPLLAKTIADESNQSGDLLGGVGARYGVMSSLDNSTEWETKIIYRSVKTFI